jgi:peptide/nickel transport system substrate-binding protein
VEVVDYSSRRARMTTADEALSREVERGMTREDLLRRAAALGIVVAGGAAFGPLTEAAFAETQITRGGTFRLPVSGSGAQDFIDGQHIVAKSDIARLMTGWDRLAYIDERFRIRNELATELRQETASRILIRIRQGVEFHNGKTLTIDDVIYSIRRTANKKLGLFGNAAFQAIDVNRMRKLDNRTVRLFLKRPDVTLIEAFAQYFQGIVPVGYAPNSFRKGPLHTIGTGPYRLQSFTPGRQSVHVRNENYWREGQPYFDRVVISNFPDDSSKVNALLSGQVDAMTDVPFAQIPVVQRRNNLKIYESQTGAWTPLCMRVDVAPFRDNRVRQALRLLANRPQIVRQGLSGFGRVANDIFSPLDPAYAGDDFPQRRYDPERARSLLRAAGQENLTVELITSPADTGMVEGATIFAENARAGGVTVRVRNVDGNTIYGDQYLKWPFSADYWGTRSYLPQVAFATLRGAAFNETHWDAHPQYGRYARLYNQAVATVNPRRRAELIREMQRLEYDQGGYIIWGFKNLVDAHSTKIGGLKTDRGTLNLNKYGNGFRTIYFV